MKKNNMKSILFTFLTLVLLHFDAHSQKIIRIYLDNNVPVTTVINESKTFKAEIKAKKYARAKKLVLKIENDKASVFKNSLELTNKKDSVLYKLEENIKEPNTYLFDVNKLRSLIKKYPILIISLLEEPKNPQMRVRSKSTVLMNIHFN